MNKLRMFHSQAVVTLTLGPFAFFNVQKTKYLQMLTSVMRWIGKAGVLFSFNHLHQDTEINFQLSRKLCEVIRFLSLTLKRHNTGCLRRELLKPISELC